MVISCLIICLTTVNIVLSDNVAVENDVGIYGGERALADEAMFMASVWCTGYFTCGGSVIHDQFILTAAHCLKKNCSLFQVKLGTTELGAGDKYFVETIIKHHRFNTRTLDYDIGLLKLFTPIVFTSTINVIGTANEHRRLRPNMDLTVFGWGDTEQNKISKILLKVNITFIGGRGRCNISSMTDRMFCAGGRGKKPCNGDSGGPIIHDGVQVGLVSHGAQKHCGSKPEVFTKLSKFAKWIKHTIAKHSL